MIHAVATAAAADGVVADAAPSDALMPITSILPTLTGTSSPLSGRNSALCETTSCSCERAVGKVAAMAGATQIIDQPPVLTRVARPVELLPTITTMPPQGVLTIRLCLTLQNEAHKTAAVSTAVPTITTTPQPDPRRPVATVRYTSLFRVHVALGPHETFRSQYLAISP